jgi:uncharacterized protein (UPF0147 family)
MGSDTTERILEKKYKLSKSVAKEVAAEARELLDLSKNVLWSKALERECLLITDARGLTKDGVPVGPKKQYFTLAGELLEPVVEDDSVPKKLRRSSRSINRKSTLRRSNSDPDGRKSTRIGRLERLRASHSCSDLKLTGDSALQGFFANVLGGKKLELVQDNARGLRLSECDLKSMASTTMSTCGDDNSIASSNSGWKWGASAKTADTLSTMSVDDLDESDEDFSFRQLSIRFDTSLEQKAATQAPKAPKRRGSFDGEQSCLDCPPPTTVLVRGASSSF